MVYVKGDIVAVEKCGQEICCCSYLDRAVASAGVKLPVIVNERDLKQEPGLAVLVVEAGSGEGFVVVVLPELVVGSTSAAAAAAAVVGVGN